MGTWIYAWNSLKMRKESKYLLIGQSLVLSSSIFALLLTGALTESLFRYDNQLIINSSLSNRYAAFSIIIAVLSFISALVFYLMTIRTLLRYKKPDIALMIAVGGLIERIQNMLIAEVFLFALIANILAIGFGIVFYLIAVDALIFLQTSVLLNLSLQIPFLTILIFSIIFLFISYIMSAFIIIRTSKTYYVTLLEQQITPIKNPQKWTKWLIWPKRRVNALTVKLARINFARAFFSVIGHLFTFIIMSAVLVSIVFGSILVHDSTIYAMNVGIGGNNVYAITMPALENFIISGYKLFSPLPPTPNTLNYTFSYQTLKQALINMNVSNVLLDPRLIVYTQVEGFPNTLIQPSTSANLVSTIQIANLFVVGINFNQSVSNWEYIGQDPHNLTTNQVAIGEYGAYSLFSNPLDNTHVQINSSASLYATKSILTDPLLRGRTIYVSLPSLTKDLGLRSDVCNYILLKINNLSTLNAIQNALKSVNENLVIISLAPLINQNSGIQLILALLLLILIFPTIIAYFAAIITYCLDIIEERRTDLRTLKALGANLRSVVFSVEQEIMSIVLWGLLVGTLLGVIFILVFTIPDPQISLFALFGLLIPFLFTFFIARVAIRIQAKKFYAESLF